MTEQTISARVLAPVRDATPWIALGLALAPAATQGLGRFAYALLLPAMRNDLSWSYADAGIVNAANAFGYLCGALFAARASRAFGPKRLFLAGFLIAAAAFALTGATRSFNVLLILRFLAGVMAAFCFVTGAALVAAGRRTPMSLGIYFVGPGFGIVASALSVPPVLSAYGWSVGWAAIAGLSLAGVALSLPALLRAPLPAPAPQGIRHGTWPVRRALPMLVAYGTYGAGYIAYMTFIVAYLRADRNFGESEITVFWAVLGLSGIVTAFLWRTVLERVRARSGAVLVLAVLASGAVLPMLPGGRATIYLSAVLFGGAFMSVVTAMTNVMRRLVQPHAWASAIGLFTVMFAIGQCIGPVLSGAVSDGVHGLQAGLWLSGGILALATLIAMLQREEGRAVPLLTGSL